MFAVAGITQSFAMLLFMDIFVALKETHVLN